LLRGNHESRQITQAPAEARATAAANRMNLVVAESGRRPSGAAS